MFDNLTDNNDSVHTDEILSLVDIPAVRAVLIALYVGVFLLCYYGNLLLLFVVVAHPSMRTATNFFLANLAVADFLVAVFCVIQRVVHQHAFFHGHWPLGDFLCRLYIFLLQMVPSTSASLLLVLSVERYVAVLRPITAKRLLTKGLLALVAVSTWLINLGAHLPFFFSAKVYVYGSYKVCSRDGSQLNLKSLLLTSFLLWYVAPLLFMAVIYTMIAVVLWKSTADGSIAKTSTTRVNVLGRKKNKNNNTTPVYTSVANPANNTVQENSRQLNYELQQKDKVGGRRRVIRLLIAITTSFAVLCLPHHVRQLWSNWTPGYKHDIYGAQALFPDLAFLLLFLNSAVNPVLYALMSKKFRQAIKEVFGQRQIRDRRRGRFVSSMRSTLPTVTEAYSMTEC